ncbi:molybdenum cofactor biosynthesis protein MoaE [Prosthecomicrobium pneumaticum]|uniref:Molybdopterin synthase catalytic subunit n=1 Tax=Prosthecomicrobium pneumaticum TaxID=81895 RepID=A0A7W9CT70_9HYPH|nr:molybdenum cofactor biosynthesis protein MoaE [Prosthecomicrobium pneumaticum]MBB5751470.1 molybdopterin synthase catalytic subunit [Prosthecomicrobium pneumaticum]
MACRIHVAVSAAPFDQAAELAAITAGRTDIGAVVTFTGLCRDEDGRLAALELEHYPGMAEAELGRIAAQAAERWPVQALTIVHRHGRMEPGAPIVLVAAASPHRHAAFAVAEFVMDFLKTHAPFWKKEHGRAGDTGWVAAKDADDDAASRWREAGVEDAGR